MRNYSLRILTTMVVFTLFVSSTLFAQTKDNRWSVGLHLVQNNYKGDLGPGFLEFQKVNPGVGLSLSYYLSSTFDVSAKVTWAHTAYEDLTGTYAYNHGGWADKIGTHNKNNWRFYGGLWTATANLKMKLNNGWLLKEEAKIAPFIIGGVGMTRFDQTTVWRTVTEKVYSNLALYYGAGFNIRLSEKLNMLVEAGIYNPMTDTYDGVSGDAGGIAEGWKGASESDDQFLQFSVGLTYNLGSKKDADGDGISDRKDKCPDTPVGVAVDDNGCPIDTDGDGVADYMDKCPNIAGTIKGCPDADGDGIADKDDECPNERGLVALKGCPDTDGDGVTDKKDKEANTPKGVSVDKDGVSLDSDGDGVADYLDKCPSEKGLISNNGCPEKEEIAVQTYSDMVHFNFNSSVLDAEARRALDTVADKMKANKVLKANISGYTDSIGGEKVNQKLAERRAAAVKQYLASKGVDTSNIITEGYGKRQYIADNTTAAGRAKNRRAGIEIELK